jgi:hypothetical protein
VEIKRHQYRGLSLPRRTSTGRYILLALVYPESGHSPEGPERGAFSSPLILARPVMMQCRIPPGRRG